jgi:hypothetical protein
MPIADGIVFAAKPTADTADGGESSELPRVALESLRAVGPWYGADDSAWVSGCDGVRWDVLVGCISKEFTFGHLQCQ